MIHSTGSHSQWMLTPLPYQRAMLSRSAIWIRRCSVLESTLAMGMISRGNGTRLIRLALSISEVVPEIQAIEKKLNGTNPHIRNKGKLGSELGRTLVKTKVSTAIITRGFNRDQNTPRDMLR